MNYSESMFVPPWHEWSNDFINAEKWDQFNGQQVFKHPGGHERLPVDVQRRVIEWKRPGEIFGVDGLLVQSKEDKNDIDDLLTVNEPLMNVKIYRWILYHIVLYTSRFKNKWPQPWHPSSLVFSCCKAEVVWNKKSKPEYNPYGKYWIKLFFMGKFRMICVSDHLPISVENHILLPLCENTKVLWLPLLVKGLLRIYSLAHKFDEFNTITCLTGWSCIRYNCESNLKEDLWLSFLSQVSNSVLDFGHLESKNVKNKNIPQNGIHVSECFPIKSSDNTLQCYHDNITPSYEVKHSKSIVIALTLSPTVIPVKEKKSKSLNQYSQPVFLNYVKITKNKSLPSWKKHRWMKWAIENNIIKQHELCDSIKLANICAPCTVILKETCPLMKILSEYKTSEDQMQYELDFSYIKPFATHVEFYVKSSRAFPFVKSIFFRNENGSPTGKDGSDNDHAYPSEHYAPTDDRQHCCIYLHFESSYCETMLFTLSVCGDYVIRNGNIIKDSNILPVDYPFVNVEQFFWYEKKPPTPLSSIRTRGVSYDVIKFRPGLNVLKIWGELPSKYSLAVESTVDFSVFQTVQTVFEKLTDHPKSLMSILAIIKKKFLQLCTAEPDTGNHGQKLQEFYSSFMPPSVKQETELKKIERLSNILKPIQTAVIEWVENKFPIDLHCNMVEVYMELQVLFQNKLLGQKQIFDLDEKSKLLQLEEQHNSLNKQQLQSINKSTSKKSNIKFKLNDKRTTSSFLNKSPKETILKCLHENMFEILCNVLNSDNIDLDEYYLKNDLLNYVITLVFDENIKKHIDPLLLFRLELNTHSTSKLAPTIIQFSNKCKNDCATVNLTLIDNDSQMEIKPSNLETNLFMINRTIKGYTLIGWLLQKNHNEKYCFEHKLSFYGRPYQILHACGMQNDRFYEYNTTMCDHLQTPQFVTKHVQHKFYKNNINHLLARVFLSVENAALYTIYCYLEKNFKGMELEIRVVDKNYNSTIFASSRVRGNMALIPIVFLNPNYNNIDKTYYYDDTENSIDYIIFAIEVILIKNIVIDCIDQQHIISDKSNAYDWTISCTYDSIITDVILETDTFMSDYQFFSSIPKQITNRQRSTIAMSQKSSHKRPQSQDAITTRTAAVKYDANQSNLNHCEILESMMIKPDDISKLNLLDTDTTEPSLSLIEEPNAIRNFLNDLSDKQFITGNTIKNSIDTMTENRQVLLDNLYGQILNIFELNAQRKSNSNVKLPINVKQSRSLKKKT